MVKLRSYTFSALEAIFNVMRSINPRFTYLLTNTRLGVLENAHYNYEKLVKQYSGKIRQNYQNYSTLN